MRVKSVLAWREDIGHKTIRIPKLVRDAIGVDLGDKVLATGPGGSIELTAVIADPSEIGRKVSGLDASSRKELGITLGQRITVTKPRPRRRRSRRAHQTPKYLFSYGSNNPDRLENVRLHHPLKGVAAAYLPNYRLCFLGYSHNWYGGVAGLKRESGAEACGYVAQVSDEDLDTLDIHEGVARGYYYRKTLPVMVATSPTRFKEIDAVVYLPGPLRLDADEHFPPSNDYLSAVEETIFTFWGHDECQDYLDEALEEVSGSRRNPDFDMRSLERRAAGGDVDAVKQYIAQCRRSRMQPAHSFGVIYMKALLDELKHSPEQEMAFDMLLSLVQEARALNVILYLSSKFYRDTDGNLKDDWFFLPENTEKLAEKNRLTWLSDNIELFSYSESQGSVPRVAEERRTAWEVIAGSYAKVEVKYFEVDPQQTYEHILEKALNPPHMCYGNCSCRACKIHECGCTN